MIALELTVQDVFEEQEPRKVTAYFNISTVELPEAQLALNKHFELSERLQTGKLNPDELAENANELTVALHDIAELSYGVRDGNRFVKSKAAFEEFKADGSYEAFLTGCLDGTIDLEQFFIKLLPKALRGKMQSVLDEATVVNPWPEAEVEPGSVERNRANLFGNN